MKVLEAAERKRGRRHSECKRSIQDYRCLMFCARGIGFSANGPLRPPAIDDGIPVADTSRSRYGEKK